MTQDEKKRKAAEAALAYVPHNAIIGVGTGSTVNYFIAALAQRRIAGAVASSNASATLLQRHGVTVVELNQVTEIPVYVDGADEALRSGQLIKGGGGALTQEKIIASASQQFVCILDDTKLVETLGCFPVAVEVIPMAQNYVMRKLGKLGGRPVLRTDFVSDNGNSLVDIHDLAIPDPKSLEAELNNIPGIVCNGIFAQRTADILLIGSDSGVKIYSVR